MGASGWVNRKSRVFIFLGGVLSLLLAISPVFGQGPTGTILGTVKDSSGGVIPDAKVTVQSSETGASRTEVSGPDGAYRFSGVPIGHYNLKAEKDGFKTLSQTGLVLDVDQQLTLNLSLEIGTSAQEVVVTGEAPLVNTTTSSLGGLVNEQRMAELPLNGRNYVDLTLIQAGVNQQVHPAGGGAGAQGTWFSSNGAPARSNNFTLDGAPLFNQYGTGSNSEANTTLGVDGIREFKLITNMFSAEYGLRMGSQMVMVSKSGSNSWHGDAFEYLRNDHMDARNFFDTPTSAGLTASGQQKRLPTFQRNNFGGSGGGPIRKDKTFFYLVYEGLRERQGASILDTTMAAACHDLVDPATGIHYNDVAVQNAVVPAGAVLGDLYGKSTSPATTSACGGIKNSPALPNGPIIPAVIQPLLAEFPLPNVGTSQYSFPAQNKDRVDYAQLRVDQNFSAADSFFTRFTFDDSFVIVPYTNVTASTTGTAYPQFHVNGSSRNQWLTLGENHIFSPTLLNSLRISWSRTNFGVVNVFPVTPLNPWGPLDTEEYINGVNPGSGITALSPATNSPAYHVQNIGTLGDDAFKTAGKHSVKFGVLLNMFQESNFMFKGNYNYPDLTHFLEGYAQTFTLESTNPALLSNSPACLSLPMNNCTLAAPYNGNAFDRDFMFKTFGFYVQDDWQIKPRITLNLGLRYEFMGPIHELYNRSSAVRDIDTSTSATLGPVMDNPTYKNFSPRVGVAWDVFGTGKTSIRSGFGIYYDIGNLGSLLVNPAVGLPPFALQSSLTFPSNNSSVISFPLITYVQTLGANIGLGLQTVDYQMKQPHSLQYNLTVEQQLPWGIGLSVAYVGTRGINLYTDVQGDPVIPTATCGGQLFFGYSGATVASPGTTPGIYGCPSSSGAGTVATGPVTTPSGAILPANTTTACFNAVPECRTNPNWGATAAFLTSASNSWYNALQLVATKRLSNGLQFQAGYTFSKSLDTTTGGMPGNDCSAPGGSVGVNPQDVNLDKGPTCSNVPNAFHFNYIYHLPEFKSDNFAAKLAQGWWLGGILTINDGFPFTPTVSTDRSLSGSNNCSLQTSNNSAIIALTGGSYTYNYLPYDPSKVILGTSANWYNPLMFTLQPIGFKNTCPRDFLSGPNERNFDFSINKDTRIKWLGESGALEFRAEIFNIFNRANLGLPNGTTYTGTLPSGYVPGTPIANAPNAAPVGATFANPLGTAGQITTTQTNSRQIQLALKLIF